jgi:hypothetical protein
MEIFGKKHIPYIFRANMYRKALFSCIIPYKMYGKCMEKPYNIAILTLEVGSLQITFRLACQQPSLVWEDYQVSLTIDAVLVNSRALRPPLWNSVASLYDREHCGKISLMYTRKICE